VSQVKVEGRPVESASGPTWSSSTTASRPERTPTSRPATPDIPHAPVIRGRRAGTPPRRGRGQRRTARGAVPASDHPSDEARMPAKPWTTARLDLAPG
jgi:hypothetical protein